MNSSLEVTEEVLKKRAEAVIKMLTGLANRRKGTAEEVPTVEEALQQLKDGCEKMGVKVVDISLDFTPKNEKNI